MSYFARSDELPGWAAHVPDGWGKDWLKWSVELSTKRPTESEQEALPYISNEDIASWTGKLLVEEPKPAEADSRTFQKDDVLFNKLRPYLAKVYHAGFDGVSSGELLCLRPSKNVEPRFLFYVLVSKGFIETINSETFGSKMPRADWEIVGHQPLPLPTLETQRRIARFLDEKTARIDGLIEKKRALLDRLAEKRQALITRAVTKGLNPDAPMKPSGIDWLGDIPAHWGLVPFKWRCRVQSGQVDPREPEYADMPLIAPDHIESGTGRLYEITSAEEQGAISGKYLCPPGSVLYSKIRPALRKVALYDAECLCSADMYAIDPGAHFDRQYLFYFLLTDAFTSYAELESLRVAMPKVNREALGAFPLPVPSRKEQSQIAAFCQDADQRHRHAGDQVRASIKVLEDYRAAIITAAVTGQVADLA
ncbi:restriction endonuclease subunit S [Oceanicaulis alexandrii]|uniref:restriction endonuclease subunit S n=1 Tax=Oceanicaulis alexandrii TaxID=153233 RepID=UPI003BB0DFE8